MGILATAEQYGVPGGIARAIKNAANDIGVAPDLAFALIEQESDFRHIFGHDPGGMYPGLWVTRRRYRRMVRAVKAGHVSNGVGLTQITYGPFLIANPKLWRKRANVRFGLKLIKDLRAQYGSWREALAVYNGGPSNPQYDYADSVLTRKRKWHRRFN